MSEWVKWEGGENPVPGKKVQYRMVDNSDQKTYGDVECSNILRWEHIGDASDIVSYRVVEEKPKTMRTFESGATRDTNEDKLDYKGFLSMIAIKQFAEYMHKHRKQADGSMRDSDNWKKGIPLSAYEESLTRHVFEWLEALEHGDREKAFDIAPAIWFNLQGWMHEEGKKRE